MNAHTLFLILLHRCSYIQRLFSRVSEDDLNDKLVRQDVVSLQRKPRSGFCSHEYSKLFNITVSGEEVLYVT